MAIRTFNVTYVAGILFLRNHSRLRTLHFNQYLETFWSRQLKDCAHGCILYQKIQLWSPVSCKTFCTFKHLRVRHRLQRSSDALKLNASRGKIPQHRSEFFHLRMCQPPFSWTWVFRASWLWKNSDLWSSLQHAGSLVLPCGIWFPDQEAYLTPVFHFKPSAISCSQVCFSRAHWSGMEIPRV